MDIMHIDNVKDTTAFHEKCHECGKPHLTGEKDYDDNEIKNTLYHSPKSEHSQQVLSPSLTAPSALANVAMSRVVCRDCYIKDFQEVHPNEPLPLCVTRPAAQHGEW